jgi:hypothetical protein
LNGPGGKRDGERPVLVPLERELRDSVRRRELMDQLMAGLGRVNQLLLGGMDRKRYGAYASLKKSFLAAIDVLKNFRS